MPNDQMLSHHSLMRRIFGAIILAALLIGCNGTDPPTPAFPVAEYLAQSINLDGAKETPLREGDRITHRRFDVGRYQSMTSFLTQNGARTTWSYAPFGPFDPAAEAGCPPPGAPCRGDGGEQIVISSTKAQIVATQDGGTRGVQRFLVPWVIVDAAAPDCGTGWLQASPWDRLCRTTVTLPAAGLGRTSIIADAFISEHSDADAVERRIQARGWGLAWWGAFDNVRPATDPALCSRTIWDTPPAGMRLTGCRLQTQLEAADGSLSTGQLWRP